MKSVKSIPAREVLSGGRGKLLGTLRESRKEGGITMNKKLQLELKDNLVISSSDGEGVVFDLVTRKSFWINETATFLLKLFKANNNVVPLSSARRLLQERYFPGEGSGIAQDFTAFVNQLEGIGLASLRLVSNGSKIKNPDVERTKKPYQKPIIEEDIRASFITGATVRAARMAASRAAAVSRAVASGFRGFK